MHKGDRSHQSASQYPKVLLKMITNTNTFLDIHNYVQEGNGRKEKKEKKKKREKWNDHTRLGEVCT